MDEAVVRQLDGSDREALLAFRCHQRNRWTKDVQRTVRVDVSDLVSGALEEDVSALPLGWFVDGVLAAVAVYSPTDHFEVLCLAIATDFQGRGWGRRVKQHLLDQAADLGFDQVFSRVHRGNTAMLSINYALGAWVEPEEQDRTFHICVTNVGPSSRRPSMRSRE